VKRSESNPGRRASGPTDLNLGLTGAVAACATVVFYAAVVIPLSGTYFGELFGERGKVPYFISFLSLWAVVVLLMKYRLVLRQREALQLDLLPRRIGERITPGNAAAFVAHLDELPGSTSGNALVGRIRRALEHFEARRDGREVVDQLASQAQTDADAVESSYTMVRVFIWAVPILRLRGCGGRPRRDEGLDRHRDERPRRGVRHHAARAGHEHPDHVPRQHAAEVRGGVPRRGR
jgi:hypothetical protein